MCIRDRIEALHNTDETMKIAENGAREMGMVPYYLYRQKNMSGNFENVGYAREGRFGIYNILIMEEVQTIIALGAGTVTKRVYGNGRIERDVYKRQDQILISGDTLFQESVGRTDFPTGSMSALVRSVKEKLFTLPDETRVYPGHGMMTTIGYEKENNAFV